MNFSWHLLVLVFLILDGTCFAIICHKCDSVTLPECATSLDSTDLPTEECQRAFSCASSIVDSVTYRGCSTNTPIGPDFYKTCPEDLCNKGVFPPGRLKCHQCNGTSCAPMPLGKPTPCLNFDKDDNCYTDVIDEIDTFRGCYSDKGRTPSDTAVSCEINGCNNLAAVKTLTCSKCDSYDGKGCKMDLFQVNNASCVIPIESSCSSLALLGHEQPSCFLYQNLDHVVRGCTFDSAELSLDEKNFDTCETSLCNKRCLKQQKCIVCDSETNDFCKSNPASLSATTCEGAEVSSCFSCELSNGTLRRGCGAQFDYYCYQCQNASCNDQNFTKCYKCSSDDSPNCSQWANPNIIDVESCKTAGSGCISAVLMNGKTLRGCESPQLKCDNRNKTQSMCNACSGSLCNGGVYPPSRLRCHHCDGRKKCSEVVDNSTMLPCLNYDNNDACFEFLSGRETMVRGCRSDTNLFYECLLANLDGNGCRRCSGSGCNMSPPSRSASLLCHKCSRENQDCSWQQGNTTLEMCQKVVKFLTEEHCFTRRYLNGSTSRSCSLDENEIDESDDEFSEYKCTDNGCNDKPQVVQKCIVCRGSIEGENVCIDKAGTLNSSLCGNGSIGFEQRGCYTKIDGEFIQRGCASELTSTELQKCKDTNESSCYYCHGTECNTSTNLTFIVSKNSSPKVTPNTVQSYTLVFLAMIYLKV